VQACILGFILLSDEDVPLPGPPLGDFVNVRDKGATGNGTTDDSKAITLAFNEAQTKGMDLYFPAGTYNFNGLNLNAKQNVRIFGDGEKSILYKPGQLNCYGNVALEDLSIYKETGIYVYLRLEKYVDVFVNRVNFYNDLKVSNNARFVYASVGTLNSGTGVNNVTFTNNNVSKCMVALQLLCEVRSGFVDNNTIKDLGDPNTHMVLTGITLGNVTSTNKWIRAENVTVSNNTITGLYTPDYEKSSIESVFSILVIGNNVKIIKNHLEDQTTGVGVYSKATNLTIKDNTFVNAGSKSSICVKVEEPDGSTSVIEGNDIESNKDSEGSIRIHAANFIVKDNKIRQNDKGSGILAGASAISSQSIAAVNGIIEGNDVYAESRLGIMFQAVNGTVHIRNNTLTQNIVSPQIYDLSAAIHFRAASESSVINVTNNKLDVQRGQFVLQCSSTNKDGSIVNFEGNTISAKESTSFLFSPYYMTCNLIKNNITVDQNTSFAAGQQGNGILTTFSTSVHNRIENNTIQYNGNGAANLFSMKSLFSMTGNTISFGPGSKIASVVNYLPTANVAPARGAVSAISNNIIGNLADAIDGKYVAHIDYLAQFNTGAAYTYPQLEIKGNTVLVNLRLLGKSSVSANIKSNGSMIAEGNALYSVRFTGIAAIIDQTSNNSGLTIEANLSLSSVIDDMLEAAKIAAQEEADRLAAEAERLAAEQAAAEATALAEAEEAARLAAEAEEAARLAAEAEEAARLAAEEAARLAAEQKAAEEAEAAAQAAAEEAARILAEQEAARAAAEEEERLAAEQAAAAEEAARLAAEEEERLAREEEARLAAEAAAREAEEAAAAKAAQEEADRLEAEAAAKQAEAEENEKAILPQSPTDFTFYSTKDGYIVLQFASDVICASNKCVTIDGKAYNTSQYDKTPIIVNVKTNTGQLNNTFKVTAQVIFPAINNKQVQTLTRTLTK